MENSIISLLEQVRSRNPLVQNISNLVVMNNTANALLAIGASPIMAHAREEIPEILQIVQALVINIGTIDLEWAKSKLYAASIAQEMGRPWVLDPVGAGISQLRNETLKQLLEYNPTVIRGNASEIMALHGLEAAKGKGVDSTEASSSALQAAKALNKAYGSIICISGEIDYIVSDKEIVEVANGSPLMTKVTGLGCSASAILGAYMGLEADPFEASCAAVATFSLAGELAAKVSNGPGSLQVNLLDQLYNLTAQDLQKNLKVKRYAYSS